MTGAAERIVVGYDASPQARAALEWAMEEARRRQAAVEIVLAWQFPGIAIADFGGARLPVIAPEDLEHAAETQRKQALATAAALDPTIEVSASVERGHPAEVLVAAAKGADLLVVGSRGRGGFSGMLLGSVSNSVAGHAPCPVVIVR